MFLLRNKDRYGVWYSTQATARVLATLAGFAVRQASPSSRQHTEIFVNGTRVDVAALAGVALDADGTNPVRLDLSRFTRTGSNRVEIRGRGAGTVQIAHTWYVPWADATTDPVGPLRLAVRFNKTEGKIGDAFTAEVNVERVGFRGYGMMIAEIGLPPGVDVDRRSLDETMRTSELFRYDVLPDRIVVYLWPKAGGSRFQFKFHARYGIDAQTAPSVLYDYYNPEAQAAQKPARFVVR
jgi:hypothetical protein